jgi:hypothetical protein
MVKLDLNKADIDQSVRKPIPAGTIVPIRMKLLPGDVAPDKIFTRSKKGDCVGLKVRYSVTDGEYAGRNFQAWHLIDGTTEGHKEARAYTFAKLRAIVDAVHGLDPRDKSPEADRVRTGVDVAVFFNSAVFLAELGVETGGPKTRGGNFADKNVIARVLRLGDDGYRQLDQTIPEPPSSPPHASNGADHGAPEMGPSLAGPAVAKPKWAT